MDMILFAIDLFLCLVFRIGDVLLYDPYEFGRLYTQCVRYFDNDFQIWHLPSNFDHGQM